jgi:hypothetical protein
VTAFLTRAVNNATSDCLNGFPPNAAKVRGLPPPRISARSFAAFEIAERIAGPTHLSRSYAGPDCLLRTSRSRLVAGLEGIGSAEEAATWAHRVIGAKGTLVAADAKHIEDRFNERLPNSKAPTQSVGG